MWNSRYSIGFNQSGSVSFPQGRVYFLLTVMTLICIFFAETLC